MRKIRKKQKPVHVVNQPLFSRNFLFAVVLLTIIALAYLGQRSAVKSMLFEISDLEKKLDQLVIENRNLQREMYRLSLNDVIRERATTELHMVEPGGAPKFVFYEKDEEGSLPGDLVSELIDGSEIARQNPNSLISAVGE